MIQDIHSYIYENGHSNIFIMELIDYYKDQYSANDIYDCLLSINKKGNIHIYLYESKPCFSVIDMQLENNNE